MENTKNEELPEKIQVCFVSGVNSEHYINLAIETLLKTSIYPDRFEFIIGLNDNNRDIKILEYHKKKGISVRIVGVQSNEPRKSLRHGDSLNQLLKILTTKYAMIVDCDITFLKKGWDVYMTDILDRDNIGIVGTEHHRLRKRYMNFPAVYVMMFKTQILQKNKMDFKPYLKPNGEIMVDLKINDKEMAKILDVNVGSEVVADTGHNLPIVIKKAGYKGEGFTSLFMRDDNLQFLKPIEIYKTYMKNKGGGLKKNWEEHFKKIQNSAKPYGLKGIGKLSEFTHNNEVFFTHLGESQYRVYQNDYLTKWWLEKTREWLKNKHDIIIDYMP